MPSDFASNAREIVPSLTDESIAELLRYRDLLAASAAEFNLVSASVRDIDSIERRHIAESLAFGALLAARGLLADGARVLDVGTGAGLPGLPLKIAWPSLKVTLLEATGKKCRFLESVVSALGLEGVEVVEGRAEELAHTTAHRASYDLVVARAVAALPVLLEYCVPFLGVSGVLAATKGSAAQSELESSAAALEALGASVEDVTSLEVPGLPSQSVVIVRKHAETPERYPRRTGIPTKRPLG
jgi:16S rRNA (guanine527-N7)-methyltransferase